MRGGDVRLGEEIRRNRKLAGLTQADVAREFGISPKTVGKWERGRAFPSPRNIRALRRSGLLDPGSDEKGGAGPKRPRAVSSGVIGRATARLGGSASAALSRVDGFRDDGERALVALFRTLSVAQRVSVLEVVGGMRPAGAGAPEEEDAGPDR